MKKITKILISGLCLLSVAPFSACEIMWNGLPDAPLGDVGIELFDGDYKSATEEEVEEKLAPLFVKIEEGGATSMSALVLDRMSYNVNKYGGVTAVGKDNSDTLTSTIVKKGEGDAVYYEALGTMERKDTTEQSTFVYNDGDWTYYASSKKKEQESFTTLMSVLNAFDHASDALASILAESYISIDLMWSYISTLEEDPEFEGTVRFEMAETDDYIKIQTAVVGTILTSGEGDSAEEDDMNMRIISVYDKDMNVVGNYVQNKSEEEDADGNKFVDTMTVYTIPYTEQITPPDGLDEFTVEQTA